MANSEINKIELLPFSESQYNKTMWMDGNKPSINAERLLKIETGIYDLYKYLCTGTDGNGGHYQNLIKTRDAINQLLMDLETEQVTRENEDSTLDDRISYETARASESELDIKSEIGKITDEADKSVNINGVNTPTVHGRIKGVYEALHEHISTVDEALAYEVGRSTSADEAHGKAIEAHTGQLNALNDSLSSEIVNREANIASLTESLNGEVNRAKDAESDLSVNITTLSGALTAETNRATAKEKTLQDGIDEAEGKISDLETGLTNEVGRAKEIEASLETAIGNEKSRAIEKEGELAKSISSESIRATARENDIEKSLTDNVASLSEQIGTLNGGSEASNGRITDLESNVERIDTQVTEIKKKVDTLTLMDINDTTEEIVLDSGSVLDLM